MQPRQLIEAMRLAEQLKNNTRHSWTSTGRHESVAEHSWALCFMALLASGEYPGINTEKLLKMCILHDLGEAFTGDIPAFVKGEQDRRQEAALLDSWVQSLPAPLAAEFAALYREMEAQQTPEAKLYKALDKMEAVVQHNMAPLATWLPLEYDLQLHYGARQTDFSAWTQQLRAEANRDTHAKVAAGAPAAAGDAVDLPDKLPTRQQALQLLAHGVAQNPGPWGLHSKLVAHCAGRIAQHCGLDSEKAWVLGLLHDIGRAHGFSYLRHVWDGWQDMAALGWHQNARICLTHSFPVQSLELYVGKNDLTAQQTARLAAALAAVQYDDYDRLIQLCDTMAGGEGIMPLEQRMEDVRRRYGRYPEAKWQANLALQQEFSRRCGQDLYQLVLPGAPTG